VLLLLELAVFHEKEAYVGAVGRGLGNEGGREGRREGGREGGKG